MRNITIYSGLLIMVLLFTGCADEEIAPSIAPENPLVDSISVSGDPAQSFSMDGKKSNVTDDGYRVDGNLYVKTDNGKVTLFENATFTVSQDMNGNLKSMQGSGPFEMPDFGFFKKFSFEDALQTSFVYNTGKYFKDTNGNFQSLPLRDTSYYFFFNILNLANGDDETLSVKNAELGLTSYFLNLDQQEIIIPTGKFEINTPEGPISIGDDLAIGLSVKKSFPFTPQQYADSALNAVIQQQQAFDNMSGLLYLAGEIGIGSKIVPLKLDGSVVFDINLDLLFSGGFNSDYTLAMNGNLVFGHALLDLLPLDFEAQLTNTTATYSHTFEGVKEKQLLKFAGSFDDNKWMETFLDAIAGTNVSKYVPFTGNEGNMFMSLGEEWECYVNTYFAINTPHLGKQSAREGTLHVTKDELFIQGGLAIPFVPGELTASGRFGYDGKIHLQAKAEADLEIQSFNLKSNLDFDIYNDHATLKGDVFFPYGIGKANVNGIIDGEGLTFSGSAGNKPIQFGEVTMPVSSIELDVNIRESNPYLRFKGGVNLPQMEQPLVQVSGSFDSRGLEARGALNTAIKFSGTMPRLPFVDAELVVRSWQGVFFHGQTVIPYGIASASFTGQVTSRRDASGLPELSMHFLFNGNPTFKIRGYDMPTSDLQMRGSTMEGISFDGRIELERFGYLASSGKITGNNIQFSASFNSWITVGGRNFDTGLTMDIGNQHGPNLAKLSGWLKTPFNQLNVNGTVRLDGHFNIKGITTGCAQVPFIPNTTVDYVNTFNFSSFGGFGVSAATNLCQGTCEKKKNCEQVAASVNVDWAKKELELCVPIPGVGNRCFGI